MSKNKYLIRGLGATMAAVTNLIQASELVADILYDENHFMGTKSMKIMFWVMLTLLAAQETEKARYNFERVAQ